MLAKLTKARENGEPSKSVPGVPGGRVMRRRIIFFFCAVFGFVVIDVVLTVQYSL